MITWRNIALLFVLAAVALAILYLDSLKIKRPDEAGIKDIEIKTSSENMTTEEKAKKYERAKELVSPDGFINSEKFSLADLIGKKVIIVDFWTYSCINCQRTTPYLNAWYEKYSAGGGSDARGASVLRRDASGGKDKGLEIVGVHTPEFEFEKKYENVLSAVKQYGIKYPVVQDNNYFTWTAYGNRYWPHKYLIDIDGFIVYDHIGEGGYAETEKKIQELLLERIERLGVKDKVASDTVAPKGAIEVDSSKVGSPEIYFGSARNLYLGNGVSQKAGAQQLKDPSGIKTNILYLVGDWNFQDEFAESKSANAKIIFRYQARDVYFVASSNSGAKVKILKDSKPLGANDRGADVSTDSTVLVKSERLYKLIEGNDYGEHTLEMIIENPGLNAFTFTFG